MLMKLTTMGSFGHGSRKRRRVSQENEEDPVQLFRKLKKGYYRMGTFHGKPSGCLMYELSHSLRVETCLIMGLLCSWTGFRVGRLDRGLWNCTWVRLWRGISNRVSLWIILWMIWGFARRSVRIWDLLFLDWGFLCKSFCKRFGDLTQQWVLQISCRLKKRKRKMVMTVGLACTRSHEFLMGHATSTKENGVSLRLKKKV